MITRYTTSVSDLRTQIILAWSGAICTLTHARATDDKLAIPWFSLAHRVDVDSTERDDISFGIS